jgi:hypothetical protein
MDQISNHPLYKIHNIDSAISSLWDFYKKKFAGLFIISLVMALITQYFSTTIDISELQSITDPEEMLIKMKEFIWPMVLISIISLFFSTIIHYYVIYNPLDTENSIFRSFVKSMRYFIPYVIIMILLAFFGSFALLLGIIALVIGVFFAALYVMVLYLFILPVMIVEGPIIAHTIVRTFTLAHRSFWANMGWTAVIVLILLVISVMMSGLVLLPFTGTFIKVFSDPGQTSAITELASNPIYIIINAIVSALIYPALPIFAVILYFNGRAREEQKVAWEPPKDDNNGKVKVEDLYSRPIPEESGDRKEDDREN